MYEISLTYYNKLVFTDGISEMHRPLIVDKNKNNFMIKENAKTTNINVYYEYGNAVLEREKNTTVH